MMSPFLPTQFVSFTLLRPTTARSPYGRIMWGEVEEVGAFRGILAQASNDEKERWRQLTHPVSHKVIQRGVAGCEVRVGDHLQGNGLELMISALPYNVGGLGHWTIYYCHLRSDLY